MPKLPVALGFYESESLPLAAQECKNLYPMKPMTQGALDQSALFYISGLKRYTTAGSSANRGVYVFNDFMYVVNGAVLYKLDTDGIATSLGAIEGTGPVYICDNSIVLCILSPRGKGYFVKNDAVIEIDDATFLDYGEVTSLTYKDGYFIFSTDDEVFISSSYNDNSGMSFDALSYSTAEVKSDKNTRVMNMKNELYIIGELSTEVFQNAGISGFPFLRINGAMTNFGTIAPFSLQEFDNNYVFVGREGQNNNSVYIGLPGTARKISTPAIDTIIQGYTPAEIKAVTSWVYSKKGGIFYGLNFPDRTFVYDAMATAQFGRPMWHERLSGSTKWRAENIAEFNGELYCGDNQDGRIGELTGYAEYGSSVKRVTSGMYLQDEGNPLHVSVLELNMETGVGRPAGEIDDNPTILLSYSDDGGRTFTEFGSTSIGYLGQYDLRVIFRRLGRFPNSRIFRLETDNTNKIVVYGMIINGDKNYG